MVTFNNFYKVVIKKHFIKFKAKNSDEIYTICLAAI